MHVGGRVDFPLLSPPNNREIIRASWRRSEAASVERSVAVPPRVSDAELDERLARNAPLIQVAALHLEWLSRSLGPTKHVTYLTDADGVVLYATGTAPEMMEQFGLRPGFVWSERTMGTSGAGTALAAGEPIAVIGPEHYAHAFANSICTAAPIHGSDNRIIGALDISTGLDEAVSERLLLAAHVAYVIEQQLHGTIPEPSRADAGPASDLGTVLNVDDHALPRYVRGRVLRDAGFRVIDAANGREALRLAKAEALDLAIIDVRLPDTDGRDLARQLKEQPQTAGIAVINVSAAYVDPEDRVAGLDAGADAYLVEPIHPRELVAMARSLVREVVLERLRREAERRLEAQYGIARALAEGETFADAGVAALKALCRATVWDVAELWTPDSPGGPMRLRASWHAASEAAAAFTARSELLTFSPGQGLVGAAWAAGQPVWVADVMQDARMLRAGDAAALGLRTGCACPVFVGGVVGGVLVTFSERVQAPTDDLVRLLGFTTRLLGQFLARLRMLDLVLRREHEARDQLLELESIYQTAPIGLCVLDRDLRFQRINRRLAEMNGLAAEDHVGRTLEEVVPNLASEAGPALRRVLQSGEPLFDVRVSGQTAARPGQLRHWIEHWIPLRSGNGSVGGVNIVAEEVTDRVLAEEALRNSEERFRVALKHSSITVSQCDRDLRYTWVYNPPAPFAQHPIIGRRDDELLDASTARPLIEAKTRVLRTGEGERLEFGVLLESELRVYDLTLEPLRNGAGSICGVTAAFVDVTARHKDAAELARALVAEKTVRKAAEAASREKDNFLAILSHELRTPLNVLAMALPIARSTDSSERRSRTLLVAERQVAQLTTLVEDLLEASRVSRGKVDLRRDRLDLAVLLVDIVEAHRPRAHQLGLELTFNPPGRSLWVDADQNRLRQVFGNLLSNAFKYSEPGSSVAMTAEAVDGQAEVGVRDDGAGISSEILPRIFDLFAQASEGTRGGLGIGLAVVRGLVELHGGSVDAASEGPGRGSKFTVRLPLLE